MATKEKKDKKPSCTFEDVKTFGVHPVKVGEVFVGQVEPKEFGTGSYGLGYNGPLTLQLPNGAIASCMVSLNIIVKHSKPAA
jgi:hypothetical protein